jgi:hypothetical protein
VFVLGVLLVLAGLGMIVIGFVVDVQPAGPGLVAGGLGVGLSGLLLTYLDAPRRGEARAPLMAHAKATILDASATSGAVAGDQTVELTLEVRPDDGMPFQVQRRFPAGRVGPIEQGRTIDVVYDPANPQRVELA